MNADRKALLPRTMEVWQPLAEKPLTEEDAREIVQNVTGFFSLLIEADAASRAAEEREGEAAPH